MVTLITRAYSADQGWVNFLIEDRIVLSVPSDGSASINYSIP